MTTSAVKNRRRQGIDRTRGQFDDILEELTHKIDVPARVRDKVHDAKQTVQVKAEEVKQQAPETAETLQETAVEAASQVTDLADQARDEVPLQVAAHVAPPTVTAKQRPLPIAAVVVAVLMVLLVLRRLLRRKR